MSIWDKAARWRHLAFLGTGPYLLETARATEVTKSSDRGTDGAKDIERRPGAHRSEEAAVPGPRRP
jgi:hypothetical protein